MLAGLFPLCVWHRILVAFTRFSFLYYASVSIQSPVFWLLEELLHQLCWRSWHTVCFESSIAMYIFIIIFLISWNLLKCLRTSFHISVILCECAIKAVPLHICKICNGTIFFSTSCECKRSLLYFQLAYFLFFLFNSCNFKANKNCKCNSALLQLFPLKHLRRSTQRPRHKGANLQYYFTLFTSTHLWLMGVTRANNQLISFGCVWAQCGQLPAIGSPCERARKAGLKSGAH